MQQQQQQKLNDFNMLAKQKIIKFNKIIIRCVIPLFFYLNIFYVTTKKPLMFNDNKKIKLKYNK